MTKNKTKKICIICGRESPNSYGECLCSCDMDCFQSPEIYKLLKKLGIKSAYKYKK